MKGKMKTTKEIYINRLFEIIIIANKTLQPNQEFTKFVIPDALEKRDSIFSIL